MSTLLKQLELAPHRKLEPGGLVSLRQDPVLERVEERDAVEVARKICNGVLDALLFRRFADGRSSQVAACVIDNTSGKISDPEIADLHRALWLNGDFPLLYVAGLTDVRIFSCVRQPDFWQHGQPICCPAIQLRQQVDDLAAIQRFSARRLLDGSFWQDPELAELADYDQAAHQRLIRAVKAADAALGGEKRPELRRLLLLTVLVKYLEDRRVFPEDWFREYQPKASSFLDVLKAGRPDALHRLFQALEEKFNGGIFDFPWDAGQITGAEMRKLALLAEGQTENGQVEFWKLYSFEHIPVEVISSLYEEFADREQGAVFTPPLAVRLLLDFALPYAEITGSERILDPTCGSGVFLVAAFKRLVLAWRANNGWRKPTARALKAILKQSLYGIELDHEAAHLTSFSLALALCDALQPDVIWKDLRFDKLDGRNIVCGSFYDERETVMRDGAFDLVIGNPPFKRIEEEEHTRNIPNREMAYSVLKESFAFVREGGRVCLIQPSGILYNFSCREFAQQFFTKQTLETVFDFVSIDNLFSAKVTTVALLCKKATPEARHETRHLVFRRTVAVQKRLFFEIDHYDDHRVGQGRVAACGWIWRVNLFGGGRLEELYDRLGKMPKLLDFIHRNGWTPAEGYKGQVSGRKNAPCDWLTGQRFLPSEALQVGGIDQALITEVKESLFNHCRDQENFTPPLVLIKEHADLPSAFWDSGFLAFRHHIFGIFPKEMVGREKHAAALKRFAEEFDGRRKTLAKLLQLMGTRAGVARATGSSKQNILDLPWPVEGFDFCEWEEALLDDLAGDMVELVQKGAKADLFATAVNDQAIKAFQQMFLGMLRGLYSNIRFVRWKCFDGFAYCAFCFGRQSELEWPDDGWSNAVRGLVYGKYGEALRTVRVLRIYRGNTILLVKPKALRYWIRSTAIRDADEVFADLRHQGY